MKIEGGITVTSGAKLGNFPVNAPIGFTTTFNSSTTWSIPSNAQLLDASMLLIGSGGGGGGRVAATGYTLYIEGGGGAGGYVYVSDLRPYITPGTVYTITVGGVTPWQTDGESSSAFGFTAYGGGKGGSINGSTMVVGNGASGGGAYMVYRSSDNYFASGPIGTAVIGQGYSGNGSTHQSGSGGPSIYGGGGGGAGGTPAYTLGNTAGGPGVIFDITGTPQIYCRGGNAASQVAGTYTAGAYWSEYGSGGPGISRLYGAGSNDDGHGNRGVCILKYTYILI